MQDRALQALGILESILEDDMTRDIATTIEESSLFEDIESKVSFTRAAQERVTPESFFNLARMVACSAADNIDDYLQGFILHDQYLNEYKQGTETIRSLLKKLQEWLNENDWENVTQ